VDERTFIRATAEEFDAWLKANPIAPDLREAPSGWHKHPRSFTILGEGECVKTLFTIYARGKPMPGSTDLDEWQRPAT
jgi:hypothetical protein